MILGRQSGLGRGLGAIIPPKTDAIRAMGAEDSPIESTTSILEIPIHLIDSNPHQPREQFDHTALEDLIHSIQTHGVLQPILVTQKLDGRYELIAGERRLRASHIAGRDTIPAIVRSATEQQKLELAIIENVQRKDLNPMEEARAYLLLQSEFHLTQDEIGSRVGKSRPQVANTLRLLSLPQAIQDALAQGKISQSNARTLLSLSTTEERMELFQAMLAGQFTVRQTEARVLHPRRRLTVEAPNLAALETRLRDALGAKVTIKRDVRGEGEIKIAFLNEEDLNTIVTKITT